MKIKPTTDTDAVTERGHTRTVKPPDLQYSACLLLCLFRYERMTENLFVNTGDIVSTGLWSPTVSVGDTFSSVHRGAADRCNQSHATSAYSACVIIPYAVFCFTPSIGQVVVYTIIALIAMLMVTFLQLSTPCTKLMGNGTEGLI